MRTPFLDLSEKLVQLNAVYDERGLLGLAFHPQYSLNGRFFVYYSGQKTGEGIDHESIIAEYRVSGDLNVADPTSERIILELINQSRIIMAVSLRLVQMDIYT